ncbi:hypothetical protein ACFX19_041703 [Malus domestica]
MIQCSSLRHRFRVSDLDALGLHVHHLRLHLRRRPARKRCGLAAVGRSGGCKSKSVRSGWIIHEYYGTKSKRGSNPSRETDQQRDFVLCLLKYKPIGCKSDNKKLEGTSICNNLADPGNRGYIASSSGDDQAATANHDHGEPGGGVSSDFIDQALRVMIQKSFAPLGGYLDSPFPPPEAPQLHQQPRLGNDPDIEVLCV